MPVEPVCLCGCPQLMHKQGKAGCRAVDCGCDRYEVDEKATAEAEARFDAGAYYANGGRLPGPPTAVLPTPNLDRVTADLARVEQERGEARVKTLDAERSRQAAAERSDETRRALENMLASTNAELSNARTELEHMREHQRIRARVVVQLNAELDQLRVEHQQARDALGREKERRHWVVARDTGEGCEKCEQPIQRGQAYVPPLPGVGLVEHVHCPDLVKVESVELELGTARRRTEELEALLEHAEQYARDLQDNGDVKPPAEQLYAYDAWSCLRDGGCGARYTVPDNAHPCGHLTPITVTFTRQPEGHTTA